MKVKYTNSKWFLENNGKWIKIDEKDWQLVESRISHNLKIARTGLWSPTPDTEYHLPDDVGFEIEEQYLIDGEWKYVHRTDVEMLNDDEIGNYKKVAHLKVEQKQEYKEHFSIGQSIIDNPINKQDLKVEKKEQFVERTLNDLTNDEIHHIVSNIIGSSDHNGFQIDKQNGYYRQSIDLDKMTITDHCYARDYETEYPIKEWLEIVKYLLSIGITLGLQLPKQEQSEVERLREENEIIALKYVDSLKKIKELENKVESVWSEGKAHAKEVARLERKLAEQNEGQPKIIDIQTGQLLRVEGYGFIFGMVNGRIVCHPVESV